MSRLLITCSDYAGLGYSAVPPAEFLRYEAMARKTVDKYCFGRVTANNITDDNKRGVCELVDVFYYDMNPQESSTARLVSSFSNEGYSESYAPSKQVLPLPDQVAQIISAFFTPGQLYRGVQ